MFQTKPQPVTTEITHQCMDTEIIHKAFGKNASEALRAAEDQTKRLERLLSRFRMESDISKINRSAGLTARNISPECYDLLAYAQECSLKTDGLFDATIGVLVDLWNVKHATNPPTDDSIGAALQLVGYRHLILDPKEKTAELEMAGQSLDLGGIGKGYASDCCMQTFKAFGVESAFSNIGGNVSTLGKKPDGSPWRIGIRHPRNFGLTGALEVSGKSVVTSGDYERFFMDSNGRRFHHILDPRTGYPAESGLLSATIVAEHAVTADALSTAVFVGGLKRGLEFLTGYSGAEAIFIDTECTVYVTKGLQQSFQSAPGINVKYV